MFDFLKKEKAAAAPAEVPSNPLLAIQDGEILPVEKVPDPVFARKVLGDGYVVNPVSGKVPMALKPRTVWNWWCTSALILLN